MREKKKLLLLEEYGVTQAATNGVQASHTTTCVNNKVLRHMSIAYEATTMVWRNVMSDWDDV